MFAQKGRLRPSDRAISATAAFGIHLAMLKPEPLAVRNDASTAIELAYGSGMRRRSQQCDAMKEKR
ncbi:hypothetical protein ASE04_25615 [Rhizobium sp. Root708]|nr:hypothetical protein ASE04_25615 [Rhizobium sp. Root708]